ncbi:MAG: hypothetical protein K0M48_04750, partial [Thiobacillus sp.]|nr:hypothetical protein [Thiobacillus sp.]
MAVRPVVVSLCGAPARGADRATPGADAGASLPPALIPTPAVSYPTLKPVDWAAVTFWQDDAVSETWGAFLQSCST